MKKGCIVGLICFFLFLRSYSQNDTMHATGKSATSNSILVIAQNNPAIKMVLTKKEPLYKIKPRIDIPIVTIGTVWSLYAFTKIYKKPPPTVEEINNLKTSDINAFDRWAVRSYSKSFDKLSSYPFLTAMPLPLVFFLTGDETRSDFFKLTFLYWEAMSVTGLLGTSATYNVDRYRPYAYSPETPMDKRTNSIAKNSFYSGHVQIVATPTFFIAKVYADYHPESKSKWIFYSIASAATGATAYMRLKAGEHFPSDILLGTATGVLAGILIPQYHKTKSAKAPAMGIMPYSTGDINGLVLTYKFNK